VLHVKHASRKAVAEFCCRRARDGAGAALWASDRAAEALEESDHPRSLCGVGQAPSAGTEIVGYVLEVACSGDHRGHGLVGEEIFEEELARGRRVEVCGIPATFARVPRGRADCGQKADRSTPRHRLGSGRDHQLLRGAVAEGGARDQPVAAG